MKRADRVSLAAPAPVTSLSAVGGDLLISLAASSGTAPRLACCPLDVLGRWRPIPVPDDVVAAGDDVLCARQVEQDGPIVVAHTTGDEPAVMIDEAAGTAKALDGPRWVEWLSEPRMGRLVVDGDHLAVWDVASAAWILEIEVEDGRDVAPARGALTADGAVVAAAGHRPGLIELRAVADGSPARRFDGGPERAGWIGFAPGDRLLVVIGACGETAQLWDCDEGRRIATTTFNDDQPLVTTAGFHPGGELIALGGRYGAIDVVRLADGELVASAEVSGAVGGLVFIDGGARLVGSGDDGYLEVWDL